VSRELLLALDLGTTSVRALLVDAGGGVLARARA
jgi:sugar (pentulose or hexulose) kinase